uniref:EEF1A lysine methyltransferase 1 n=1 Tax=Esox lucius TaxID=8010 RepID=A0AAY5L1E0_ESOLU
MSDSDDDVPQLSAATLAALQEFYAEERGGLVQNTAPVDKFSVGAVEEDWRMSQFWYNDATATRLAEEVIQEAGKGGRLVFFFCNVFTLPLPAGQHVAVVAFYIPYLLHSRIACLSAPSVYQKLKQGVVEGSGGVSAVVLEYDRRFATYGQEFVFYDYNEPLSLPEDVAPQSFDIVLADPPYLSEECLTKVAQTVKYLAKGKVLLCTGAIMEEHAEKLLGLKICRYIPKHNKNLANEFRCFTNYPSSLLS